MTPVVTVFLRHSGEVLLVRRSDAVGTYADRWGGVSGYVEPHTGDPLADARRKVREETGIEVTTPVRRGEPLAVTDDGREWRVHPFLFESPTRNVEPNEELAAVEWTTPTAVLAGDLRNARPGMAVLPTRIDRVMSEADRDPASVRDRAVTAIADAIGATEDAAERAAERLGGPVATLSRSGTVRRALLAAGEPVVVAASRPGGEGVQVAEELADTGLDVTLTTDTALAGVIADGAGSVLVGADTVRPSGAVRNKVDTYAAALAADRAGVPFLVVTAADKISGGDAVAEGRGDESADRKGLYDGPTGARDGGSLGLANPRFELVPPELVDRVVTERGALDAGEIAAVAAEHDRHADWVGE